MADLPPRQIEVHVEWRVVRDDGVPVPQFYGAADSEVCSRHTLLERRRNGQRGPYKTQRRVIELHPWVDAELPAVTEGPR